MSNFDYKKYLVENKLTANSKMLSEAAKKPTIKILKDLYYFDKLGSLGAKADVDEKYHSGAKLVFKKGKSVEDDTTHDDSEYKMITSSKRLEKGVDYEVTTNSKAVKEGVALPNNPGDLVYVVDEKEVNFDSIELGQFINSNDIAVYVIESAMFIDGTTLDPKQLTDLEGQYFEEEDEDKRIVPADLVREYDMEKTGESIQYEFKTEEGSRVKIGADNLPRYINSLLDKAGNKGVTLTFISKIGPVPDYKITKVTTDAGTQLNL